MPAIAHESRNPPYEKKLLIMLAGDAFAALSGVKGIADTARRVGATNSEFIEALRSAYCVAGNKAFFTAMAAFKDRN